MTTPRTLRTLAFIFAAFLFASAPAFVSAQTIRWFTSAADGRPERPGRPKPTPTPAPYVDAERDWGNTGTDFNAGPSWVGGTAPGAGDVAWFKVVKSTNPNLSASAQISGLYFSSTASSNYTLSATSPFVLTLTGYATDVSGAETGDASAAAIGANNTSGTNTISAPLTLAPASGSTSTIFQASGGTLAISGAISGSAGLTKAGAGTLILTSTSNSYTGDTTINAGTLQVGNDSIIPFGTGKGNVVVNASGTLLLVDGGTSRTYQINGLSGSGTVDDTGSTKNDILEVGNNNASSTFSGQITDPAGRMGLTKVGTGTLILSGTNSYIKPTTISGGTLQLGDGGTTGSLTATASIVDNANLTINRSNAFTQATDLSGAVISGSGSFTQAGSGTTTLNVANTYTGATTVSAGTLNSAAANALGATSGITVNGTGTLLLSASNTINNAATMTLNGNTTNNTLVLSGASEGTSTTTTATAGLGALTLQSQSRLDFLQSTSTIVFGKTGATAFVDTSNFKLDIYNYIGDSTPAGNSDHLVFQQDMTGSTGDFEFWNGSSFVGATTLQLGTSGFWEIVPLSAVPEPSTWVVSCLVLVTLICGQRRRFARMCKPVWLNRLNFHNFCLAFLKPSDTVSGLPRNK